VNDLINNIKQSITNNNNTNRLLFKNRDVTT